MIKSGIFITLKHHTKISLKKILYFLFINFYKEYKKKLFVYSIVSTKIKKFNILKSPFIFKKTRDSLEIRWFSRVIGLPFKALKKKQLVYSRFLYDFFFKPNPILNTLNVKMKQNTKNMFRIFIK